MKQIKETIDSVNKIPVRILMSIPFVFCFILSVFLLYKDKDIWLVAMFGLLGVFLFYFVFKNSSQHSVEQRAMSSQDWFSEINGKLSDGGVVRIYLRSFDHPDNFGEDHRERLMDILTALKDQINSQCNVKIIAYHSDSTKKSGADWVKSEVNNNINVDNFIKIINKQPTANSTSLYIFDDKTIIYNKKIENKFTYHKENYSNSIIHEFLILGFESMEAEQ